MSQAPTITMAITIHIVRRVLLMLGWNVIRASAAGTFAGSRSTTVCGAGTSRARVMKQAGNEQGSPGFSRFGGVATIRTNASIARTATMSASQRRLSRLRDGPAAEPSTCSVATGSLVTVPPHTGARLVAALGQWFGGPRARSVDRLQEPAHQPVDQQRSGAGTRQEPDDHEDRHGPQPLVDPVAGEHADQRRDQE